MGIVFIRKYDKDYIVTLLKKTVSTTIFLLAACQGIIAKTTNQDLSPSPETVAVVTTIAGNGSQGFENGTGTNATFNLPYGVAVDGIGNVYVADTDNQVIRKITTNGVVSTLAGGSYGFQNGTGTNASFGDPEAVAVDNSGNIYVVDNINSAIRKITTNGVVSTLAGGSYGFQNGTGTNASFKEPTGVAVDNNGNVYVADRDNNAIRKITTNGVVTTLAGNGRHGFKNGKGTNATFNLPSGVAVDGIGNVYVVDRNNNAIRKITTNGVVTTLAGKGSDGFQNGTGTNSAFFYPEGVAVDNNGNVYVADTDNDAIRKITSNGVVTTLAGKYGFQDGTGAEASFWGPMQLAVDSSGNVYVADSGNNAIRKITILSSQTIAFTLTNAPVGGVQYLDSAMLSASSSSGLPVSYSSLNTNVAVVVTNGSSCSLRFVGAGTATIVATQSGSDTYASAIPVSQSLVVNKLTPTVSFNPPGTIAYSRNLKRPLFASTTGDQTAIAFASSKTNVASIEGSNALIKGVGMATLTASVPASANYNSASNNQVLTVTKGSQTISFPSLRPQYGSVNSLDSVSSAGLPITYSASANVKIVTNQHSGPTATFVGIGSAIITGKAPSNPLYNMATTSTVVSIEPPGSTYVFSTLAGNPSSNGNSTNNNIRITFQNGNDTNATFNSPSGVAVDNSGNVYVADINDSAIRKITSNGVVTTLAGGLTSGFQDGRGSKAIFNYPAGVAVDHSGNVYVADALNNVVRKITSNGVVTTFAGNGSYGFQDGTGTNSAFYYPAGIAVDAAGNVYVADTFNCAIRKITSSGVVTTLAGNGYYGFQDGTGNNATFNDPNGLAVDSAGNVYVADALNNAVRKIDTSGHVTTFAGNGTPGFSDGNGFNATFSNPEGVAVDGAGNVYVTDTLNNAIRKIDASSNVTTFAGNGTPGFLNGVSTHATFSSPVGVAADGAGNIYVGDAGNNVVRKGVQAYVQSISFPAIAAPFRYLNATASSYLPVSYSSSDTNIAIIKSSVLAANPSQIVFLKPGTVTITATQAGGTNNGMLWFPAPPVTQTLSVPSSIQ